MTPDILTQPFVDPDPGDATTYPDIMPEPVRPDEKPAELDEVGRLLVRAAEIVRKRGWLQGSLTDGLRLCLVGGIRQAAGMRLLTEWSTPEGEVAYRAVERVERSVGGKHPADWNDEPGRTKEQVLEILERAAWLG